MENGKWLQGVSWEGHILEASNNISHAENVFIVSSSFLTRRYLQEIQRLVSIH